jgi:hypothetical protein
MIRSAKSITSAVFLICLDSLSCCAPNLPQQNLSPQAGDQGHETNSGVPPRLAQFHKIPDSDVWCPNGGHSSGGTCYILTLPPAPSPTGSSIPSGG